MVLNEVLRALVILTDPDFSVFSSWDRKHHPEVRSKAKRWQNKLAAHGLCKRAFGKPIVVSAAAHSRGSRLSDGRIIQAQPDYQIDIGNLVFKLIPNADLIICDHGKLGFRVLLISEEAELTYDEIEAVHEALRKSGYYLTHITNYVSGAGVGLNYIDSANRWLSVFANSTKWTIHSDFRELIRCPDVYSDPSGWESMFDIF